MNYFVMKIITKGRETGCTVGKRVESRSLVGIRILPIEKYVNEENL